MVDQNPETANDSEIIGGQDPSKSYKVESNCASCSGGCGGVINFLLRRAIWLRENRPLLFPAPHSFLQPKEI